LLGAQADATTPDGETAIASDAQGTVNPVSTATNQAGKPIKVGTGGSCVAIAP
jgi:hypothetical protein